MMNNMYILPMYFLSTRKVMPFLGIIRLRPLNAAFHSESKEVGNRTSWSPVTHARFGRPQHSFPYLLQKAILFAQAAWDERWRQGAPCIVRTLRQGCKLWDVIDVIIFRNRSQASCATFRTLSLSNMKHETYARVYLSKGAYRRYKNK